MLIEETHKDIPTQAGIFLYHPTIPNYPKAKFPGVVIFSEIYQVTGPVARFARQIAGHGFIVAAPSSYHEFTAPEPLAYDGPGTDKGNEWKVKKKVSAYDEDATLSVDALLALPTCNGRIGATGMCLGGHLAYRAALDKRVAAAVCYFATDIHSHSLGESMHDDSLDRAGDIKGELVMIFGKKDNHVPPEGRDLIRKTLHEKGVIFSFYEPAWAQHAFIRDELSKGRYDPGLVKICFEMLLEVFNRTLRSDLGPRNGEDASNPPPEKKARWKKCPICWDSIYVSETRPVRWYTGQEGEPPREGGDVVLRLVMRETGSTLALPRDGADALAKGEDVPWHFAAEVMDYARVMKGTEDYIVAQFDQDIQNLQTQEHEDELMFGEDTEWTRKAVRMINEAKEKTKGIGNPPSMTKKPEEPKAKRPPIQFNSSMDGVPEMYMIQHAARSSQSMPQAFSPSQSQTSTSPATGFSSVTSIHTPSVPFEHKKLSRGMSDAQQPAASALATSLAEFRNRQHAEYQPSEYFFYQALLHYYLSPLDIRILKAAFGSFSSFPSTILPRVERISTGHIIDDDFRKRTKYLAHLPSGCEIGFLECDWRDTVAPEVLEKFMPEIERRRKKNQDKEAREEKERVRAERIEDKEFAAARRKRPSYPTDKSSADDFQPLTSSEVADSAASVDADADADSVSTSPPYSRRTHSSAYASLASPSTSPSAYRTVWGTTAVALASPDSRALPMTLEVPIDDGWLQGWEKDLMHEDNLVAQVQAASLGESSRAAAAAASGAKGKKKGKKITLMSTNARRGA
ncbi:hypothetical protein B0A49_10215 [Cryomyces minteri]|uniref:Dienelactone hydrolase domain-containing protein n=1 Tax=Cryomyces minteri TaxID=331657 RepID=A0A4U0WR33_9PEZI|nr:hypothetical protein B0A49_10215 [Cryomyces minteri]